MQIPASPAYTDMQVENYLCSFLTTTWRPSQSDSPSVRDSIREHVVSVLVGVVFAGAAHSGSRSVKPGRKMLRFTGLFVTLLPMASKGKRKIGISEPLNAQLSTKSSHQIFKSINTVGGHWALPKNCPLFKRLSEKWALWNCVWTFNVPPFTSPLQVILHT